MDATNVEDPIHHRIAMINLWEDPRRKKQTVHPEDIEEIIMVSILAIGAIVNLTIKMKTKTQTMVRKTRQFHIYLKRNQTNQNSSNSSKQDPTEAWRPRKFSNPCKLANLVEYLTLADLGASINLMSYSLYTVLSGTTLKPTRMIIRLENHTYQYPIGVAENMLVQVGKFVFPVDFVILIGEDRATFHIDKAMQHSYVNDDTCFRMDVIYEITEDELDALLDDSKPFLNTSKKISETPLDKEFDEFMSGNVQENEVKDDFEELQLKDELRIRTYIQDPPTDLEMKPLPKHLEYAFLEENSLLPLVISSLLEQNEKERLVSTCVIFELSLRSSSTVDLLVILVVEYCLLVMLSSSDPHAHTFLEHNGMHQSCESCVVAAAIVRTPGFAAILAVLKPEHLKVDKAHSK
nr:reverse transcriptase domain-containing protein [Tanacetum cinerariifolium]